MPRFILLGAGTSTRGAAKLLSSKKEVFSFIAEGISNDEKEAFRNLGGTFIEMEDLSKERFDVGIISPGIPPKSPIVQALQTRGTEIITEIELAQRDLDVPVIPITGTNGKSTVCLMVAHILQNMGINCLTAGNIGKPLSEVFHESKPDFISLELSSYQLEYMTSLKHAHCAVITNISPDHLERHGDMRSYLCEKWKILDLIESHSILITDRSVMEAAKAYGLDLPPGVKPIIVDHNPIKALPFKQCYQDGRNWVYQNEKIKFSSLNIYGSHNHKNALMASLAASTALKAPIQELADQLKDYESLPFRSQQIGFWRGYRIINDSKSTNIASTVAALNGSEEKVILLIGGLPKRGDKFQELLKYQDRLQDIIIFGALKDTLPDSLTQELHATVFSTLQEALKALPKIFKNSPTNILFSPGCASFDEFKNFEERGIIFSQEMKRHMNFQNMLE